MTPLRQRFIDDLRLRNYSPRTIEAYVAGVARFAKHFGRSPEGLGTNELRAFQLHLVDSHVSWSQFNQIVCALRFCYGVTLGRPDQVPFIPFGKRPRTLPAVLSPQCQWALQNQPLMGASKPASVQMLFSHVRPIAGA